MQLFLLLHAIILFTAQAWALVEGDVGVVDWYKQLLGVPQVGALDTAPKFHTVGNESLVLTATVKNVLAALHPENGSVAWRFVFDSEDRINGFYKDGEVITTLSGTGGATLRSFEASTGLLISERRLHSQAEGISFHPQHSGSVLTYTVRDDASTTDGPRDLLVLTNGHKVTRFDGATGNAKWSWTSPDQTSLVIYNKVFSTSYAVYVIGVSKSIASYTVHITSLHSSTGEVLNDVEVPSSVAQPFHEMALMSLHVPHQYRPRIAWLEDGQIKSKALTPDLKNRVGFVKDLKVDRIIDVGVSDHGYLVGWTKGAPTHILKMVEDGTLIKAWGQFETIPSDEANQIAFGGGVDKDGNVYVARVYWSNKLEKAVVDLFSTVQTETQQFYFPFDPSSYGSIHHVTLTVAPNPRVVISTSTGTVQSWSLSTTDAEMVWNREEGLSAISAAEFVQLPEQQSVVALGREGEGFMGRLQRQLVQAQDLPHYLYHFFLRYTSGSSSMSRPVAPANSSELSRDPFGFRQLIIAATDFGKVYAIDTSNGEIVWSRVFGLGWAEEKGPDGNVVGGRIDVDKVYVIKPLGSGGAKKKAKKTKKAAEEVTRPEVVLVTQRFAANTLVDTVIFHIDALTGADVREGVPESQKSQGLLQGYDAIQGPLVQAFFLQNETRAVVMLDEFLQVYLYPENEETKAAFAQAAPSLSFPLSVTTGDKERGSSTRRVVGNSVELNDALSDRYVAYQTWTLSLPPDEKLQTLVPATKGPVASLGKVLGNRTTLYKYLNEKMFGALTESTTGTCGLYVVDATKGTVIYRASLPAFTGSEGSKKVCDVKMILTENWLVYHYYDDDVASGTAGLEQAKGWRMVSVEMYEGLADQKTESPGMSSYNPDMRNVTVIEQAYVFPHGISVIATTSTTYSITSKDIIVATHNNKVYAISRRLLDPRRPKRKPTAEEQEEMLIEYDPLIPDDPKRAISHNYEVANIQRIITAPALLESTSLVFAYGLDLFLTRVSPSGTFDVLSESFNKPQLVFTVMGLVLAIAFTRPMVKRKLLNQRWYQR
ncbi:Protein of unknown function (DUF1620) domain containing protein [Amanita muscaria]